MVAPTYQKYEVITDPYTINGRQYVQVRMSANKTKQVRFYDEQEYNKLYPPVKIIQPAKSRRYPLGFGDAGFIWLFKGNTYNALDWFRASPCRYTRAWGWYLPSDIEMPDPLPVEVEPVKLYWDEVSLNDQLIDEKDIKQIADSKIYEPTASNWFGKIGERYPFVLTCIKVVDYDNSYFGVNHIHTFEDENHNIFVWSTSARCLEVGHTYEMTATIKGHETYRNSKNTTLSNCRIKGEVN